MSSNKLHPIYVALDNHQYSRAVKLASSLPPSNVLGQALLAHALWKSGDSLSGLKCIKEILWFDSVELDYEIQRLELSENSSGEQPASVAAAPTKTKSKKGGKKSSHGKNKGATATATQVASTEQTQMDLIDHLTTPLTLPEGWDQVAKKLDKQVITHEVGTLVDLMSCISVVSNSHLCFSCSCIHTLDDSGYAGSHIASFAIVHHELSVVRHVDTTDG